MNLTPAHLHLMLNHLPVLAPYFLALLMVIGLWRRSREIVRVALLLTVLFSLVTGGVFLTGEPAEDDVEEQTWFDHDRVHEHEERAEKGLIVASITGALALLALVVSRRGAPVKPAMAGLVLAAIILCAALFAWTALAGGRIRHEENRPVHQTIDV